MGAVGVQLPDSQDGIDELHVCPGEQHTAVAGPPGPEHQKLGDVQPPPPGVGVGGTDVGVGPPPIGVGVGVGVGVEVLAGGGVGVGVDPPVHVPGTTPPVTHCAVESHTP